jgi:hypothetical protein
MKAPAQPGNGLLLFFRVDDFDMALTRARALVARLEEGQREPEHWNYGVRAPRSGRVLRHDQCALCGLTPDAWGSRGAPHFFGQLTVKIAKRCS